ncbi:uncharacterized protein LOC124162540 [Ischnura elegans]|uniref:uncharacterized protein LOC124162540 n=1 Tax=Ischnura elegans TaxID=197161 RepID=UPI001ED86E6F|nr:uncharacterized protein LOC124162540 [Ischnura elegans]
MATTALGGVVNIGHRNMHDSSKMLEDEYGRLESHAETSMESAYGGPQSNSPGVLRSIKTEVCPASPDSTMSSSSSSAGPSDDSHVSVLRRGPSAGPAPFVPFTAAPIRAGLRIHHQHHQPASVARRNARERNRVKQVNNGFATLRQHIPAALIAAAAAERAASPSEKPSGRSSGSGSAASKKMSKVETLRCAVEYIRSLQEMLREADGGGSPRHRDDNEEEVSGGGGETSEAGPRDQSPPPMVRCSPAPSPVSSSADSSFLPASPPPTSAAPMTVVEDGARHYLPLQPVQPFEYVDIDPYTRLQGYEGAVAAAGVLQFYHAERIKREGDVDCAAPLMLEPHPATGSPPPHGYSTSATAYLAMAPGALLQRHPGDEVDLVTEGDVTGMMTWWTEEPQC